MTIDIQNTILNANTPSNSKISNIKKSVANIHPTIQISNAITIKEYTNDINALIITLLIGSSEFHFVRPQGVLLQE